MQGSSKTKLIIFSLLPAILLIVAVEVAVRLLSLDKPAIIAGGSGVGPNSMIQSDVDLGWAMKPNTTTTVSGYEFTTNSLGLRSAEVEPKKKDEFRILSLGESSTLGIAVMQHETYSAELERLLQGRFPERKITVINAGHSAYTSFQSLKYLELRGLQLKPEMILFYHEINDYIPPTWRDTWQNEIGATKTDKELYDSRLQKLNRILSHYSGLYRYLSYSLAKRKIDKLHKMNSAKNPTRTIGLPDYPFNTHIENVKKDEPGDSIKMRGTGLGRRVTDEERLENLTRLASISRKNGIELIIIHPSYRDSTSHECLLTRFCRKNNVPMFEAYPSLHPRKIHPYAMYADSWHPTALGHELLAEGLAELIVENVFSKTADGRQSVDIPPGPTLPTPPTP